VLIPGALKRIEQLFNEDEDEDEEEEERQLDEKLLRKLVLQSAGLAPEKSDP
jgi:hypothetical protein